MTQQILGKPLRFACLPGITSVIEVRRHCADSCGVETRFAAALILSILMAGFIPGAAFAQSNDVAVVVNQNNMVTNISAAELKRIFAGERLSWTTGVRVKLLTRGPGAREHDCLLKLLHMTESEYKSYWKGRSRIGAEAPVTLPSNGMQKEAVQTFRGAIAMVQMQDVKSSMRVIKIDGRLPNQNGYPLR